MISRSMAYRTGLAAYFLAFPALGAPPGLPQKQAQPSPLPPPPAPPEPAPSGLSQEQARPSAQVIEAGLTHRREYLQKLKEHMQVLRDEVNLELADAVAGQHETILKADKEYQDARRARELAEYQVKEYVEGIYPQALATAMGKASLAKDDRERAFDRVKGLIQKREQGLAVDPIEFMRAKLEKHQTDFDLEQAQMEIAILTRYTKEKETKKREAAVASAEAFEAEKKVALDSERAREKTLAEQAERFKVRSPEDHVLALLDDAIRGEAKVVDLIADARKIEALVREKPDDAAKLAEQLRAKKAEADSLMNRAKSELLQAATLGERVRKLRANLRDDEAKLKKERELVDRLEREFGTRK